MSTLMSQARTRVPRIAEAAAERARLTVVARPAQKAPRVPFVSLVSLLLVGGVVGLLLFNTHMQQASFTATALQQQASVLEAREQSLQMSLDLLRNPEKVAARAKRLGMVPAVNPAFLRLPDGQVLGNPTIAQPSDAMRITPLPSRKPAELRPAPVIVKLDRPRARRDPGPGAPDRDGGREGGRKSPQQSEQRQGSER